MVSVAFTVLLYHCSFTDYFTCMLRNLTSLLTCLLYFYKYLSNYCMYNIILNNRHTCALPVTYEIIIIIM